MLFQSDLFASSAPVEKIHKGPPAALRWELPDERGPYWYACRIGSAPGGITARIYQSAVSGRLVLVVEWPARAGCPAAEYVASVEAGMDRASELLCEISSHTGGARG